MQVGIDYIIRALLPTDKVNSFSSGDATSQPLKTFLQKQANAFHTANIARTYVAVKLRQTNNGELEEDNTQSILAYVALISSEISVKDGYTIEDCPNANHYEFMPAVKIARLAVDSRYRR